LKKLSHEAGKLSRKTNLLTFVIIHYTVNTNSSFCIRAAKEELLVPSNNTRFH